MELLTTISLLFFSVAANEKRLKQKVEITIP